MGKNMKIIVSPSKTQTNIIQLEGLDHPKYHSESRQIIKELKQYRKEELASIMKIKGQLLDQTYHDIKNLKLNQTSLTPAIRLYTGVVYDTLKLDDYTVEEKLYLNQNVRIISALYGVLSPMDGVQAYRLDFTMKLKNINLHQFWKDKIIKVFKQDEFILDCASQEFSHFLKPYKEKVHRVEFIDIVDGQEKIISYNAKKLRGLMVDYCIRNNVKTIDRIKDFSSEGYHFDELRSNQNQSIFVRLKV